MFIEIDKDVYVRRDAIVQIVFYRPKEKLNAYAVVDWECGAKAQQSRVEQDYLPALRDMANPRLGIGRLMPMNDQNDPLGP